ncbi:MAG: zinc ribbon domain-containing protein [Phormidesmis sp.]
MADHTAYQYSLSASQTLYIGGQGLMTVVTLQSGSAGQQQQSSHQFSTGKWTAIPLLYRLGQGVVVVISTISETYYLQVQGNQMQMSTGAVSDDLASQMSQSQTLPLQPAAAMPASMPAMDMQPMPQMQPMKPMHLKMGDMEMSMGEMSMGEMKMGKMDMPQSDQESSSQPKAKRFCTQCGSSAEASDKFCGRCGNRLT